MCRAHSDRVRLVANVPDAAAEVVGQPQQRPPRRARRGHVNVQVEMGSATAGEKDSEARGVASAPRGQLDGKAPAPAPAAGGSTVWRPGSWCWPTWACSRKSWGICSTRKGTFVPRVAIYTRGILLLSFALTIVACVRLLFSVTLHGDCPSWHIVYIPSSSHTRERCLVAYESQDITPSARVSSLRPLPPPMPLLLRCSAFSICTGRTWHLFI